MEIGTIFLERYEIVEKIGEGGMAIVYKAKCNLLDRFVAIKFLKDEYVKDDEFIEKFTRESKAAAKLNHPNIVGIYDFHETELDGKPQYVIVMEYVEGCTLKELIHEKGPLEEKQAVFIAEQILSALQEAHNHGIIHRDIKPHNIMITKNHVVKVTDFGIARATSSHTMTTTMEAIGSVHYFSPEQARGSFTDQRTDIYSFGIVFYEMLTGKRPFTGENPVTVAMKHIQEDIVPPGEIVEGMSDLVEQIILKCTKKKQGERYQSIDEIMEELSKYHGQSKSFVPADEIESVLDQTRVMSKAEVEEAIERSEKKASKEIVPQPAPEKKMKETKKIHLVPIVLGILAAFILTTGLYIGFTKIQEKRQANRIHVIELPSVLGKTEAEAREILESLNLIMEVSKYVQDKSKPYGVVLQKPQEGIQVKEQSVVSVTINEKTSAVMLKDYVGQNIFDINSELQKLGVELDLQYEESSSIEANLVISQIPKAGTELKEGSVLKLVISKGEENTLIPMINVVGLNVDDATSALTNKNISWNISYDYSEETEKDIVMSQSVNAEVEIDVNTIVELIVSKGPKEVEDTNDEEDPEDNPEDDTKTDGQEQEEVPVPDKSFTISFYVPEEKSQSNVKLVRILDGIRSVAYEKVYSAGDGDVYITLESEKVGTIIELYIDEQLTESWTVE